jgi:hypothetical protein
MQEEVMKFRNIMIRQFYEVFCQTSWPNPVEDKRAWTGADDGREYWCDEISASKAAALKT